MSMFATAKSVFLDAPRCGETRWVSLNGTVKALHQEDSMSERQITEVVGNLVRHQHHFGVMSTEDRQWIINNTAAAIEIFAQAVKNRVAKEVKKLLQFVGTFAAKAVERFVAREKFVEGKTVDDVSIAWLEGNFKTNFLGKIEEGVEAAELKLHKLLEAARDLPKDDEPGIIPELAGKHETKLCQFFQLLAHKQRTKDFTWLVGYIADENGIVWAVRATWDAGLGGWYVGAGSVADPHGWLVGHRVLSR